MDRLLNRIRQILREHDSNYRGYTLLAEGSVIYLGDLSGGDGRFAYWKFILEREGIKADIRNQYIEVRL